MKQRKCRSTKNMRDTKGDGHVLIPPIKIATDEGF
jgi:hypothetical protein